LLDLGTLDSTSLFNTHTMDCCNIFGHNLCHFSLLPVRSFNLKQEIKKPALAGFLFNERID
jgi:hypothetical protein